MHKLELRAHLVPLDWTVQGNTPILHRNQHNICWPLRFWPMQASRIIHDGRSDIGSSRIEQTKRRPPMDISGIEFRPKCDLLLLILTLIFCPYLKLEKVMRLLNIPSQRQKETCSWHCLFF